MACCEIRQRRLGITISTIYRDYFAFSIFVTGDLLLFRLIHYFRHTTL